MSTENEQGNEPFEVEAARREFLRKAGKFAAVTPPAMAMLLSVTSTPALANGSGHGKGKGWGHGKGGGKGHAKGRGKGHAKHGR